MPLQTLRALQTLQMDAQAQVFLTESGETSPADSLGSINFQGNPWEAALEQQNAQPNYY